MFANLTTEGLEKQEDRLGGNKTFDTGIYDATIKLAYAGASAGGAKFVQLVLDIDGQEYRETVYITNKRGENFFMSGDKKSPLPGFTLIDNIALLTTELPLSQQDVEEKVVKIYDFDEKKEVPKNVPVLIDFLQKNITLAIVNQLENKTVKADDGSYIPTAEERNVNLIERVFHYETKVTVTEALNDIAEGEFIHKWKEKNDGKVRDKRKSGTNTSKVSTPTFSQSSAPKRNLFGAAKS